MIAVAVSPRKTVAPGRRFGKSVGHAHGGAVRRRKKQAASSKHRRREPRRCRRPFQGGHQHPDNSPQRRWARLRYVIALMLFALSATTIHRSIHHLLHPHRRHREPCRQTHIRALPLPPSAAARDERTRLRRRRRPVHHRCKTCIVKKRGSPCICGRISTRFKPGGPEHSTTSRCWRPSLGCPWLLSAQIL